MFSLKSRQDNFRLLLPNDFIAEEINEKYTEILSKKHSFYQKPIDFVNETIQSVQVLGFTDAALVQQQPGIGNGYRLQNRIPQNKFMHTSTDVAYRSEVNPVQLIDKTLNVTFRHTLGFLNYFILFENFFYMYERDTSYSQMPESFNIDIMNSKGSIYSKIILMKPIINSMDMLDLNYTQPIAQSQSFKVEFKYSNIDFHFIDTNIPDDLNTSKEIII